MINDACVCTCVHSCAHMYMKPRGTHSGIEGHKCMQLCHF
jgi:hypothetical protein